MKMKERPKPSQSHEASLVETERGGEFKQEEEGKTELVKKNCYFMTNRLKGI